MSERDGWNHLYLIDAPSGTVKNQITSGNWVVRGVERVDDEQRVLYLKVSGIDPGQDPYHVHLVRVGYDGENLVRLTEGDGQHQWRFSPGDRYLIDTWSRVDMPPVTELREVASGRKVCELERADMSRLLETGWQPPERFVAKGRDGKTDIHGIIVRPTRFDPAKSYPVLEEIYAGPHSSFVPKSFGLHANLYEMAELGFVVVKIDGMGTSNRSKAFHDVCWQNLGDSGFPDRIAWMKAASKDRPWMDLSRVGIWGGSAGGQSAMRALIAHGDFYRAAVADCGCHDNRVDKIWWNEQWMGWPIGPHYDEQSNVTQAHRLQGDLMLIWGELDRNVDPASTLQVIDALIRADKDFEQLIVPGSGHGAAGHPYAKRRQADFFMRKLLP
jgi:dipeptidyl aminopeptidase/acylaminoacyl peptidase